MLEWRYPTTTGATPLLVAGLKSVVKDRRGRTLSYDAPTHYQKVVLALKQTIRLLNEIDQTIDKHGGRPIT